MSRALLRLCLLLLILPGSSSAADLGIAAFEGVWQGSAVSESAVSANFQLTSRDIDVTIRVDGGAATGWGARAGDANARGDRRFAAVGAAGGAQPA